MGSVVWLIVGALATCISIWLVSIKENNGVIDISPLSLSVLIVGTMMGLFTFMFALVIIMAFFMTHQPAVDWFKTPFKSFNLKKDNDNE